MITLKKLQNISSTRLRRMLHVVKAFKGRSPLYPRFIQLLLTYKCNANCPFCYQDSEKKKISDMSIGDAQIIERNIRKSFNFKPRIHFFGGEPTVNTDFVEILKYFSYAGYKISMTTNGIDLLKYGKEIVETKGLREIHISLNDLDFERVLSTLKQISNIDVNNNLHITLNCPITEINQDRLLDIVEKFEHSEAKCLTFQHRGFIWHG
ncbi:MAG: radical SAM protein, partial [Candidatus Aegiribacteria sp.]|nr:radical SAM protein [Candidatus Aegiribacteria sp.]